MSTQVVASGIYKSFGAEPALTDVSFSVQSGEICGLIGPNGAGKSTLLSIMSGLMLPDRGEALILGRDSSFWKDSPLKSVGVQIEGYGVLDRLSAFSYIRYVAALHGIPASTASDRAKELLDVLGLDRHKHKALRTLSSGSRKKVSLAAAMVHRPKVLLLDEPMESLDPVSQHTVAQLLQQFSNRGTSILFSSHNLDQVERVCSTLVMLKKGRAIVQGPTATLSTGDGLASLFFRVFEEEIEEQVGSLTWL